MTRIRLCVINTCVWFLIHCAIGDYLINGEKDPFFYYIETASKGG
jgi:hypothetical protein